MVFTLFCWCICHEYNGMVMYQFANSNVVEKFHLSNIVVKVSSSFMKYTLVKSSRKSQMSNKY